MKIFNSLVLALAMICLSACTQIAYYTQAIQGHMALVQAAKPVDVWLQDPATSAKLKQRLQLAQKIRAYAVAELGLPDNPSYHSYAQLDRPYVLWNVVAAPELSLQAVQWCFPIAGCVSYRGYYHVAAAENFAESLRSQGYEVRLEPIQAYSNLGWMNDPLISTFIYANDAYLARMIFHELAHQVVYAKGDTAFNEAFATAVEQLGVERWLAQQSDPALLANYQNEQSKSWEFNRMLLATREKLQQLYAEAIPDNDKRHAKQTILNDLKTQYQQLKLTWSGNANFDRWFEQPINNANFISVANYHDLVPAFRALFEQHQESFPEFYRAVKSLADEDADVRQQKLKNLQIGI